MKLFFLFLYCVSPLFSHSMEHFKIGTYDFTSLQESYALYDSRGESRKLYREESNEDLSYILTLVVQDKTGGCSGKSIESGTWKIKDNRMTIYSFWDRSGARKDTPVGAQIKHYELDDKGKLVMTSSKLYIENHKRFRGDKSGMVYLFTKPTTKTQKEKLDSYITSMQAYYEGQFVFGDEAKKLMQEVKKALKPKKKSVWKTL